jgi:hypothetical protein
VIVHGPTSIVCSPGEPPPATEAVDSRTGPAGIEPATPRDDRRRTAQKTFKNKEKTAQNSQEQPSKSPDSDMKPSIIRQ